MTVITLSRQLGSLGTEIAHGLADRMGLQYVDRQIIFRAAAQAGTPAAVLEALDEFGLLAPLLGPKERRAFTQKVEAMIRELAEHGNVVIVGRGGQIILRNFPNVLHLKVVAPLEPRISRVMERSHLDRTAALNRIEASDKGRAEFLRRTYHSDWLDANLYDLVINTGRLGIDDAVDIVALAAQKIEDPAL